MTQIDELENRLAELEKRVSKLEGILDIDFSKSEVNNIGLKLQGKVDEIGQQKLIILILYYKPKQSKADLLGILLNWDIKKTIHKWFKGSNFKHRLLDTGFVMKDEKNSEDEDLFSLTITKGIPKAEEIIKKFNLE
ncbi:MAG: hypothetical protein IIC67_07240 [Thaumarchaeota archaeon]|nr:hypothetical protein [Nitrososphaerota archaeon]